MKQFFLGFATVLSVAAAQAQIVYPARMFPDAHVPFIHGVTSGDPLPNAVVIWTRVETADSASVQAGQWFMATDSLLSIP